MHLGREQDAVEFVGRSGQDFGFGVTGESLGKQKLALSELVPRRQILGPVPFALSPLDEKGQGLVGSSSFSFTSATLSAP